MEDKRTKCQLCDSILEDNEFVHRVEFGSWDIEDSEFESSQKEPYCRDCWNNEHPLNKGIEYHAESITTLFNILKAANGDLAVDLGSQIVGSRVFMRIYHDTGQIGITKSRYIGDDCIGFKSDIKEVDPQEIKKRLKEIIKGGDLPEIVYLVNQEDTPFHKYPEITENQSKLND